MTNEEIKIKLEELSLEPSLLEAITANIENNKGEIIAEDKEAEILDLKIRLDEEKDWRKKAKIVARIISCELST